MEVPPLLSYFAIADLSVGFRQFRLQGISLSLEKGQTLVLLGPSGSGKSVLLETVAGFHVPATGRVELEGRNITSLPPEERGLGFMFQDYALFPHLTVKQNIAFGIRKNTEADERVKDVLELLNVRHLIERRPGTLSGGEKQRVALARALAIEPKLFLFDEPLSALDAAMREELRVELRQLLRSLKATSLYVTHDHIEALVLADVLAVIRNGVIQQVDDPLHLFAHPADAWVARFLGMQVLRPERFQYAGSGRVKIRVGDATLEASVREDLVPDSASLVFRPEDVHLERLSNQGCPVEGTISAVVEAVVPLGPLFRVDLSAVSSFSALLSRQEYHRLGLKRGDAVLARFDATDLLLVPESL
jgi:ABC-type Fe3+/spermidine/putrescine transport system ATPase subunit